MTISILHCQIKSGVCTTLGMKHVKRNGVRYYACDECAKATRAVTTPLKAICAICGEQGRSCPHTLDERRAAQQLKQEIIMEARRDLSV